MIKDYKILERLGIGAFGTVYKVQKQSNNNLYVIKQIPLFGLSQEQINDVKLEAKILSSVKSIYIVRYFDSFEENCYLNIVMEYCNGGDLSQFIEKNKSTNILLKEDLIWSMFLKITIGLATLHKSKILHRDLKSLNIFLTKDLDIKIGDFGVAKILTQTGFAKTVIGTPYYLSPELCDELPYNDKSDVWALGCILYELCTYEHPFNAKCQASLVLKIIQSTPKPISKTYSENLQKLIILILDKNHLTRPSCYDILKIPYVVEKAKQLGLNEKIRCLYPEFIMTKKIVKSKNNCVNSCINISEIKNNSKRDDNSDEKRILQTEGANKKYNYNKVIAKKYINLDCITNKEKEKEKEKERDKNNINKKSKEKKINKNLNNLYFESKSIDTKRINLKKIKEKLENRSKSYDRIVNKIKNKEKLRTNKLIHSKSKNRSISKSRSKERKSRINKTIEEIEKNSRKKNKFKKNVLVLHKSKTPLKSNSNFLYLKDNGAFNNIYIKNKHVDNSNGKIIIKVNKSLVDGNEEKKLKNLKEFTRFLNDYVTEHKQTDLNISDLKEKENKKHTALSKDRIKVNYEMNKFKKIKFNSKFKNKSKSKSNEKSKEKKLKNKMNNPINYSVDIKENKNNNEKIYINYNDIINKTNQVSNYPSVNISNNFSNVYNRKKSFTDIKKNISKDKKKIYNNKNFVYSQKKYLININNKSNNDSYEKETINSNKKENNMCESDNFIDDNKFIDTIINKDNLKDMKDRVKGEILKLIGEKDYKYIIDLYEMIYKNPVKMKENFDTIEKFVKLNYNLEKQKNFEKYFYDLLSIDSFLGTQ